MKIRPLFAVICAFALNAELAFALTVKPNLAPVVSAPIGDQQVYSGTTAIIDLAGFFSDPDASAAIALTTSLGTMNFTLDGATTPITVANFLNYVDSGRYFKTDPTNGQLASLFFHRSVSNFVIQSGGFLGTVNPNRSGDVQATSVLTFPAIQNEPVISNVRGTIAMAKTSAPNSATSQWFINLANNSGLDDPNVASNTGGFTVFGRVAGSGMSVADAIALLPKVNAGSPFDTLPVRNYTSPNAIKVPNLVSIPGIARIPPLSFSASSNNGAVASVKTSGTNLLVNASQIGGATITVTASDLDGASVSQSFVVNVSALPGRLSNISTRANFPNGDEVLIGGFIIGSGPAKRLVVRAVGPSLVGAGIPNALTDPSLELHDGAGALLAQNNNWKDDANQKLLNDFGLAPSSDLEAALITTVPARTESSAYTAVMRSANGAPGVGLVEVYDLDSAAGSNVLNLSTRGDVGTGDNVLIGGFIVQGSDPKRVVIRALGPSLAQYGVPGVLPDPRLELHNGQGTLLDSNDDWQSNPDADELRTRNLQPGDTHECAVIDTLPAGGYTAIIAGSSAQPNGAALVELYQVELIR